MNVSLLSNLIVVLLLAGTVGAQLKNPTKPPVSTKSAVEQPEAKLAPVPLKKLLFFMNPNGYPCQRQYAIIETMKDSLKGLAEVEFIKTTVENDMGRFQKYGIRGLPSIVIADNSGKELFRFSPGIQSSADILAALKKK